MKRGGLMLCLALPACGHDHYSVEFPRLPALSAETTTPCPDAPPVTGSYDDLVRKDVALATEYAKCKARAATAVGAYEDARAKLADAAAKASSPKR